MLVGPQIREDDLAEARKDSATLSGRMEHNLQDALRCVLRDCFHSNLRVDRLATVSLSYSVIWVSQAVRSSNC